MKLDQLTMFKSVAELGSLRLASEHLHKTQPAISQGIRQLESTLSLVLFNRSGYRLELTEAGTILYQHALRVLDEAFAMSAVAGHIAAGNEISITLAIEASFDLKGILPLLENVQSQFPGTQIVLKQEYLTGAIESLTNKASTLCISPIQLLGEIDTKFEFHFLNSGRLMDVVSPRLLARHPNLCFARELLDEYQIIVQDSGAGTKGKDWGVQDGQRRWYVNDFATKRMLIESGMGWGKIPHFYAYEGLKEGRLVALELSDKANEVHVKYHVIKLKNQRLGPVAQALWDQFTAYTFNRP